MILAERILAIAITAIGLFEAALAQARQRLGRSGMKRPRKLLPPKGPDLRIEADDSTGILGNASQPGRKRYTRMRLPHERDESTHRPGEPGTVTKRAAKDLEAGQEDTDCYGAVGERFDRTAGER